MTPTIRTIAMTIQPQPVVEGAGVRLIRSIATRRLNYLDPFLLLDHFGSDDPKDYLAGFPMHPHRGIETVTYMLDGVVSHRDSLGNAGDIRGGDMQWMTAGRGILHEEMPRPVDGKMEGFQLWVNLPARLKMTDPRYQEVLSANIPEVIRPNGVHIRVIAGIVDGVNGAVTDIAADPAYLDISLPTGVHFEHAVPAGHTCFAYAFRGEGLFDESQQQITAPVLVVYSDGDYIQVRAGEAGVRFLLVSGLPLNEPIARYGPFVMNSRQEIEQTLVELRNGTFIQP